MVEYEEGSGNIFVDCGFDEAEAAELTAKSSCIRRIKRIRDREGWTQKQLGERIGMKQSEVSALLGGKLIRFSLERLLAALVALGVGVRVSLLQEEAAAGLVVEDLAAAG